MIIPRYYQERAIVECFQWLYDNPNGNPIIGLPGGTGKSVVIAEICRRALEWHPPTRILVVTHRKELIAQNHAELIGIWANAPAGIHSAGLKRKDTHQAILFCGIASIAKKIDTFGFVDLVIVDECDLISHREETMYRRSLDALKTINPFCRVIGLTATPYRSGLGWLTDGGIFTDFSTNYTTFDGFNELLDAGFICPLIPKPLTTELPVDGVHILNGEFVQAELQKAVDKESITRAALTESIPYIQDRHHGLCFCTGTLHADHACSMLHELGVSAVCVHSNLPGGEKERDAGIRDFKAGQHKVMVGVGVFDTGFNFKPIDFEIILRPSLSARWWVQTLSRATRISPETGKTNALILDFARNSERLGCINDPLIPRKPGKKGSGITPFKICPMCGTYNATRARYCTGCQHEFPETFKGTTTASSNELIRREPKPEKVRPPKPPPPPAEIESYAVNRVEFTKHRSKDETKPPTFKVSYICGLRIICEWMSFEASGFPKHKANEAWRLMGGGAPPATVDEALARTGELKPPTGIRVLREGKYDRVVGYDFDEKPQAALVDDLPF